MVHPVVPKDAFVGDASHLTCGIVPGSQNDGPVTVEVELGPETLSRLDRLLAAVEAMAFNRQPTLQDASCPAPTKALGYDESIANDLRRIADHFDPPPSDIVDSPYLAERLGCTTTWIADQARNGMIPKGCIVPGTGDGRPWKFYRRQTEQWLAKR
jgi:hypothetical protein